ncbi:MAG: 23S rRNA (adenine(2503)-C(2))-methyltransferase RlmN [Candidatus Muiribacteriota bacterium]
MKKQYFFEFNLQELQNFLIKNNFKKFNASQIFSWVYKKNILNIEEMTDLSKKLREFLKNNIYFSKLSLEKTLQSRDKTKKFLLETLDNYFIEGVLIYAKRRTTLCISSQIGCKLKCVFCRTGQHGFIRNISCGEIIEQVVHAANINGRAPDNIVFMGMGEPLLNLQNVSKSLKILMNEKGFYYPSRKITLSTCGILNKLEEIEKEIPYLSYAISLHSVDNSKRNKLMPVNKKYPLEDLKITLKKIRLKKRQTITIEYILIKNVNTSIKEAKNLIKYLHGLKYKINLIPFNSFEGCPFETPDIDEINNFSNYLKNKGVVVKLRLSKGRDIKAACGQLAFS